MNQTHVCLAAYEIEIRKPISGWVSPEVVNRGRRLSLFRSSHCYVPVAAFDMSPCEADHMSTSALRVVERTLDHVTSSAESSLKALGVQPQYSNVWTNVPPSNVVASSDVWEYAVDTAHPFIPLTLAEAAQNIATYWVRRRLWTRDATLAANVPFSSIISASDWIRAPHQTLLSQRDGAQPLPDASTFTPPGTPSSRSRAGSVCTGCSASKALIPVAYWMKDEDAKQCLICHAVFTVVKRRHHCRLCGKVYCSNCCKSESIFGGVRVCGVCKKQQEDHNKDMEEDALEHTARVEELDAELLRLETEEETGNATSSPFAADATSNALWTLLASLEMDTRRALEREATDEFDFISSLGVKELAALEEIVALQGLPSVVQLTDSMHIAAFEDDPLRSTLRQHQETCIFEQGQVAVEPSTLETREANTIETISESTAVDPSHALSASFQGISSVAVHDGRAVVVGSNGLLFLRHFEVKHAKSSLCEDPHALYRIDVRLGGSASREHFSHGPWSKWADLQLCVVVPDGNTSVELRIVKKGGNTVTDLVMDWTSTFLLWTFTVNAIHGQKASTLTTEASRTFGVIDVDVQVPPNGVQRVGNEIWKVVDPSSEAFILTKVQRTLSPRSATVESQPPANGRVIDVGHTCSLSVSWNHEQRSLIEEFRFCATCGKLPRRCTCGVVPNPTDSVTPSPQLPDVASTEAMPAPDTSHNAPALVPIRHQRSNSQVLAKEAAAAQKARNILIACAAEKLLLNKHESIRQCDAQEAAEYGTLRHSYFVATSAAVRKQGRRATYAATSAKLQQMSSAVLGAVGARYLSFWYQQSLAHADARKLERQRQVIEARLSELLKENDESKSRASRSPSPRVIRAQTHEVPVPIVVAEVREASSKIADAAKDEPKSDPSPAWGSKPTAPSVEQTPASRTAIEPRGRSVPSTTSTAPKQKESKCCTVQ